MNTDAPLLTPYEEFDYDDSIVAGSVKNGNFSGWSEDDDNDVDDNCEMLQLLNNETADNHVYAVAAGVVADESYSLPAITATSYGTN